MMDFIVGLGGRDIPKKEIQSMYEKLDSAVKMGSSDEVQFLGMRW